MVRFESAPCLGEKPSQIEGQIVQLRGFVATIRLLKKGKGLKEMKRVLKKKKGRGEGGNER